MFETMYDAPGIGLAAIQVGVAKRVVTMDLGKRANGDRTQRARKSAEEVKNPRVFINPEIVWSSDGKSHLRGRLPIDPGYPRGRRPPRAR